MGLGESFYLKPGSDAYTIHHHSICYNIFCSTRTYAYVIKSTVSELTPQAHELSTTLTMPCERAVSVQHHLLHVTLEGFGLLSQLAHWMVDGEEPMSHVGLYFDSRSPGTLHL